MPGKRLNDHDKGVIDGLRLAGKTATEISKVIGRSKSTITRYFKTVRAGESRIEKYSPGRPRKLNDNSCRIMKRAFEKSPRKSCKKLKSEYPDIFKDVKVRTMQDYACNRLGYKTRSARKKPLLTEAHRRKRLKFCKDHKHWTKEDWRAVMWSDESTFKCITDASKKVRRPLFKKGNKQGDPYASKYLVKTVKHSSYIMMWGAFSGQAGRGSVHFVPQNTTINSKNYLELLKQKLPTSMDIHACKYFMQDGASVHTAKIVKEWFKSHQIKVLDWPPQSPDLNPIENLWSFMKYKLQDYNTSSIPRLKEALLELWTTGLQMDTFIKFADSMPNRIKEVIARQGGCSNY